MAEQIQIKPEIIESLKSSIESLSDNIVSLNKNLEDVVAIKKDENDGLDAENQKEQRSIFTKMLGYLKKLSEAGEKGGDAKDSGLGKWALLLGGALGLIIAAIQAKVKAFTMLSGALAKVGKLVFSGIKLVAKAFDKKFLGGAITKAIGKFVSIFKSTMSFIGKIIGNFKSSKGVQLLTKGIKSVMGFITKIGKAIIGVAKFIGKVIGGVVKTTKSVMSFMGNIAGSFSKFASLVGNVARIAGKIFLPITIIIGLIDSIKKSMERGTEDGIIGYVIGAIEGLINSIIMKPLDLLKGLVSWILEKMGFDNASEALDSFSFEELFSSIVDTIMGWFKGAINWVKEKFTNVKDAIGAFFGKKPTDKLEEVIDAKDSKKTFDYASETGAVGTDDQGKVIMATNSRGDQEKAKRDLLSSGEGVRQLTPEEIKDESDARQARVDRAQDKLAEYEARPSLKKLVSPDSGLAESIQPAQPQGGDTIAGASSEVDSLKAAGKAVSNNVAVSSPTTNISNSTNNNLIKPPVRNVDPSLNQYYRNKFQMAL